MVTKTLHVISETTVKSNKTNQVKSKQTSIAKSEKWLIQKLLVDNLCTTFGANKRINKSNRNLLKQQCIGVVDLHLSYPMDLKKDL